jgi:hypothetical protein
VVQFGQTGRIEVGRILASGRRECYIHAVHVQYSVKLGENQYAVCYHYRELQSLRKAYLVREAAVYWTTLLVQLSEVKSHRWHIRMVRTMDPADMSHERAAERGLAAGTGDSETFHRLSEAVVHTKAHQTCEDAATLGMEDWRSLRCCTSLLLGCSGVLD